MYELLKNNDLVITNNKKEILNYLNSQKKILSLKIMSLNEFENKYFGVYKKEAIYYLIKKYNYKYEVSKMYLDNFKFIPQLKEELEENNLIKEEVLFKQSIKRIVLDNVNIDKYVMNEIEQYDYIELKENNIKYQPVVYEFEDIEDEINDVALNIIELLKTVDITKIKLVNVGNEYLNPLKRIFNFYNIPVNLKIKKTIYGLDQIKKFLSKLKDTNDYNEALNEIKDENLYKIVLNICNSYQFREIDETIIYCIEEELKKTTVETNKIKNAIEIIDINNINNEDYYFVLGFNQGILPKNYKDEDYLTDKQKEQYGIKTSLEKNIEEKQLVQYKITNYPNIYLSYKLKSAFEQYFKSSLIDDLNLEVIKKTNDNFKHSNLYNKIELSKQLDKLIKYNEKSENIDILFNTYKDINYLKYDNKYKKINISDFYKFIDNKLLLSYSSLDNYYRCGFRYYLNNVLKLDKFEETFMIYIGNLFHDILSKMFNKDFDFEREFSNYIKEKEFNNKEKFFLIKLKKDLLFTIETIKKQEEYISLDKTLYEQKIYINKDRNIKITFMGIVDKLKYKEVNGKTIVAIIDYKTGNPNINLNNSIYGIDMQLPIYLYLAKNSNLQNVEIGGFYLQKIVNSKPIYQMGKNNEEELQKLYRLEGYSNSDTNILKYVDKNYEDSSLIKGMKTSSKGFYAYSKILNNNQINNLNALVDKNIDKAITDILKVDFSINPKKIGQDLTGCEYCKFKDICYKKEEDIVILKEQKYQDFLGGDSND